MEMAVEVMRKSVDEGRDDGKACPKVGAVIVFPDGRTRTACRGELRDGDHAEYTLIERMLRDVRLDECVLFATLEPCAPGSRKPPKCSCAERIVRSRIKEVYVGIEDPDPTVDRKGIKYLQDSGVTVRLFERDLQEKIQGANADFIAQALDRRAKAEAEANSNVVLSHLEDRTRLSIQDLDSKALSHFNHFLPAVSSESELYQRYVAQGIASEEDGVGHATGFGDILFGKSAPQHARLLGSIHYSSGREETRDFEPPIVLIPDQALTWIRDKIPNVIDRTTAERTESLIPIMELVREGVVNALVHRDYGIAGARCQLVVTPDTITIKSPGGPVSPIKLEQLKDFNAPMLSRNPVLHYVFAKMKLAEERGFGLKSMRTRAAEMGLPLPTYSFDDPYLVLTIYLNAMGLLHSQDDPKITRNLDEDDRLVLGILASTEIATRQIISVRTGFDTRKVQRVLKKLLDANVIKRNGAGPSTTYQTVMR
jgi:ATP-dependent DNA helicase RecG